MSHNRKLVLSGVALTEARNNRHDISVMREIMDEIEPTMIATGYLTSAPFKWIGLVLRYGLKNDEAPSYQPVNKTHGDLPVAIEIDTHDIRFASRDELKHNFMKATLTTLVDIGMKYNLPHEHFAALRRSQTASDS